MPGRRRGRAAAAAGPAAAERRAVGGVAAGAERRTAALRRRTAAGAPAAPRSRLQRSKEMFTTLSIISSLREDCAIWTKCPARSYPSQCQGQNSDDEKSRDLSKLGISETSLDVSQLLVIGVFRRDKMRSPSPAELAELGAAA